MNSTKQMNGSKTSPSQVEIIHISSTPTYEVDGVRFDWHHYCGPFFIDKRTGKERDPVKAKKKDWAAITKFQAMTQEEKRKHQV